jgi:hypothetical protein
MDGWHGVSPPVAEGVPHGGMGGARTEIYRDRTHLLVYASLLKNNKCSLL